MLASTVAKRAFVRGFLDGLAAPIDAFRIRRVVPNLHPIVFKQTRRDPKSDAENIRRDFERAIGRAGLDEATGRRTSGSGS